jgi:hypothetical protein
VVVVAAVAAAAVFFAAGADVHPPFAPCCLEIVAAAPIALSSAASDGQSIPIAGG